MPLQLNLLSLDGGGVKGLSSLYILQKLMEEINHEDPPKPCDYFDMIGGTSTGGIIAIMLGRLEMTVDECIDRYVELADVVFVKKHKSFVDVRGHFQERYDSKVLENEIRKVVKEYTAAENTLMKVDEKQKCKVYVDIASSVLSEHATASHHTETNGRFVCVTSEGTAEPELLTSYRRPQGDTALFRVTTIWEAARATSAASTFFAPIIIGPNKRKFLDGGTGANNPVRKLWTEAGKTFCPTESLESNVNCLVSIGTGIPTIKSFGNGLTSMPKSILSIATETEHTAKGFHDEHIALYRRGTCYRLNAPGVGDIDMDRPEKKTEISDKTRSYFEDPEKWENVMSCAKRLVQREKCLPHVVFDTTYDICWSLSKTLQWRIDPELGLGADCPTIFEIISDYDPDRILERISDDKCKGTTTWILSHPKFEGWINGSRPSCLWLHGIVGSGKSTTTTTVVKALKNDTSRTTQPLSYFFFRAAEKKHLSAISALESFVKQLSGVLGQRNAVPSAVHRAIMRYYSPRPRTPVQDNTGETRLARSRHLKRSAQEPLVQIPIRPSLQELMRDILLPMVSCTSQPIFVIDGLDECLNEGNQRDDLIRAFTQIIGRGGKVYISSRDEVTVSNFINQAICLRVSKENEAINSDVLKVINNQIDLNMEAKPITKNPKTREEIRAVLMAKADAMFLWVRLLINVLWQDSKSDADIMKHLRSLPMKLEEIYQWCMERLSVDQQTNGHTILRWICAASTPFHIDHLREALAVNLETGCLDVMAKYSEDFVMSCSGNLYCMDKDGFVLPAHHSVTQWVFPNTMSTSLRSSMPTFNRTQAETEIGELLTSHLDYQLNNEAISVGDNRPIRTNFVAGMVPRFARTIFFPTGHRGFDIPARYALRNRTSENETLTLFCYAKNHWLEYTHNISHDSAQWKRWRKLVVNQHHDAIYPWRRVGESTVSHLSGLLGWTIMNNHIACFSVLTGSALSRELPLMGKIGFWDLPLSNYGNDPPLVATTKSGHVGMTINLLSLCNPYKTDNHGNTVLHGLSAMNLEALCGEHAPFPLLLDRLDKAIGRMPLPMKTSNSSREELFCNMQNDQGCTALHLAACRTFVDREGLGPLGDFLLDHTDTSLRDREGNSALHSAAAAGNTKAIKRLFRAYKELLENDHGQTPLHVAVIGRHLRTARVLVGCFGEENICCRNSQGHSSLNYALENDDKQMLDCLIRLVVESAAASDSIKSIVDGTIHAGKHNIVTYMGLDFWKTFDHQALVGLLRYALEAHNTDPLDIIDALMGLWQIQYPSSKWALHALRKTVLGGDYFSIIFEAISSSSGTFDLGDAFDMAFSLPRPLELRTIHGKERLNVWLYKALATDGVDIPFRERLTGHLLDYGADPNAALKTWPRHVVGYKTIQRLLNSGLNPLLLIHDRTWRLTTLLLFILGVDAPLLTVAALIDGLQDQSREHLDFKNKYGQTALWIACYFERFHPYVEKLIRLGANLEMEDNLGRSPLWIAASLGYFDIVDILLAHGSTQHPDHEELTPFAIAREHGHTDVAKRLIKDDPTLAQYAQEQ